jgi:cytochrome c
MKIKLIAFLLIAPFWVACGGSNDQSADNSDADNASIYEEEETVSDDPMENKGIGPITEIYLADEIEQDKVERGAEIFKAKCSACHKPDVKFIGPAPKGIMERRSPEWTMNMILNPEEMTQKDPIARALLMEYSAPMANQSLTVEEARDILEYFRTL